MDQSSVSSKGVKILSQRRLLDDFFKVDEVLLRYQRQDGSLGPLVRRLSLERGDSVAVLLYKTCTHTLVLVRQFRYPTCRQGPGWLLEVIAGMLDKDESPENCARREILEETGYAVNALLPIATFYLSPGGSSERIFLYYGEVDEQVPRTAGRLDEEEIEVLELPVAAVWQALEKGEIADAKTLVALLWLRRRLE